MSASGVKRTSLADKLWVRVGINAEHALPEPMSAKLPGPVFTLGLMIAMAFSIRRVVPSRSCVYRRILCHQAAQHAVDPCRDTDVRSQALFRARRSTSTRLHSTCISPL